VLYRAIRGVFILLILGFSREFAFSAASEPEFGGWKWGVALEYINNQSDAVGAGCRAWVEKYSTSSYRLWKRCSVGSTASGVWLKDFTFSRSDSGTISNFFNCGAIGCRKYDKDGAGAITQTSNNPPSASTFYNDAKSVDFTGGLLDWGHPGNLKQNDYQVSCTGNVMAGGTVNATIGDNVLRWSALGLYIRDTSSANNTVSGTCKSADTLIKDFGNISTDCTSNGSITARFRGRAAIAGDCGCIPAGHGIDHQTPNNTCVFRPITGDPASMGSSTAAIGSAVSQNGHTFTTADLAGYTSDDGTVIPISGSNAGGGISEGYGFSGPSGSAGAVAPTGTGFVGNGGGGGIGPGPGGTACESAGCLDEPTPESGFIPGVPGYDGAVESPEAVDWVDTIRDFIAGSPITAVITGSGVTAVSGECSVSTEIFGSTVEFGFCDVPASVWTTWGVLILALAHLMAAYILFR
jgi:hypothetical protein